MERKRKVMEIVTYTLTPLEVKQAIKHWADGIQSTPDGHCFCHYGDQPVELTEGGGAIITAIDKEMEE